MLTNANLVEPRMGLDKNVNTYQAWRAQIGSISVMYTTHPSPFSAWQHPLPTSPYPQSTTCLPPNITSVDRFKLKLQATCVVACKTIHTSTDQKNYNNAIQNKSDWTLYEISLAHNCEFSYTVQENSWWYNKLWAKIWKEWTLRTVHIETDISSANSAFCC